MDKVLCPNMTRTRWPGLVKCPKCLILLAQHFVVDKGLPHAFSNLILRETPGKWARHISSPHFAAGESQGELTFLLASHVPGKKLG